MRRRSSKEDADWKEKGRKRFTTLVKVCLGKRLFLAQSGLSFPHININDISLRKSCPSLAHNQTACLEPGLVEDTTCSEPL